MKIQSLLSSIAICAILFFFFQSCSKQEQVNDIIPSQEENIASKTEVLSRQHQLNSQSRMEDKTVERHLYSTLIIQIVS